jgi:uncharacterized protein (TIGR02246 family)
MAATTTTRASTVAPEDAAAVESLLQQLMDGWNRGSGAGFATPFADDGQQIAFDGTHFRNRGEIAVFHQQLFERFLKGTRLVGKITDMQKLSPDVILAHAIGGTVMPDETDLAPDRNSVQTLVAVKRSGEWRIAAFHNSRAEFMGRPEAAEALTDELRKLL